ncbi:MAG: OmpH family outer membrane protein [Nitrospirae bacterium]|nr:MAG: OmpH family outer membrane protein [Nitrospirota bacterium]
MMEKETDRMIRSASRTWSLSIVAILVCLGSMLANGGCATTAPSGASNAPTSIGVVNPQRILSETTVGQHVTEQLNSFMKDRQMLLELEQRELRKLEDELVSQGTVLSPEARKRREDKFRRRMIAYQQKVADLNREVQEKQKELLDEFRAHVKRVVASLAQTRGLLVVLEYGPGTSTLYHQPQLDLTEQVIQAMNQTP